MVAPLVHIKEVQPALPACSACVKGERCASLHSGKRAVSFTRSGCPGGGIAVQAPAFPHGRCTYIRCPILQSLTDPLNNILRHANTRAGGVECVTQDMARPSRRPCLRPWSTHTAAMWPHARPSTGAAAASPGMPGWSAGPAGAHTRARRCPAPPCTPSRTESAAAAPRTC